MANETSSKTWYFTQETNTKGYTYIYAYQTAWDPVRKQSRRVAKQYVGRLADDGQVAVSKKFIERMPEYAQGDFYYGADKTLVDEATYRQDFPEKPGPKKSDESEEDASAQVLRTRSVGATWASEQVALQAGVLDDLKTRFNPGDARNLLNLALYKLDGGTSMSCFEEWFQEVFLHGGDCLSGQRITELLAKVTREDFDYFFKLRHERRLSAEKKLREEGKGTGQVRYALDNTSISTSSTTIEDAAYGHAKRDPHLKQINYTFVCDQDTGDIVFTHTYEGSIPDVTAFKEVLFHMKDAGLDLSDVVLVTDRGYSSVYNIQRMLNLELRFVQGVRLVEDTIKKSLDDYRESLRSIAFYDSGLDVYARTIKESWQQDTDAGRLQRKLYVHLYRYPSVDEEERTYTVKKADEILKFKEKKLSVPPELWRSHGRFVHEVTLESGKKQWQRDNAAIERACRYSGTFALRTNEYPNPFEAMEVYRLRNTVEIDFNQFKNWVDGDRLRCTEATYLGKLFLTTLAVSIRLMMLKRAQKNQNQELKLPQNSLGCLIAKLRSVKADKRPKARAWVVRMVSRKQRDMFALLGLPPPPKVLR